MTSPFSSTLTRRNALALALAGVFALCSTSVARAADPIVVGYTGPLSGSLSLLGQGVRDGLTVYFNYINDQGGVNGRKFQLAAEDDAYEPARTIAAAKKLIEQDKVVAFVGSAGTANMAALLPTIEQSHVPLISPYAFSHSLTSPTKKYVFTVLPEVRLQTAVLANYITGTLKQRKIAAIYQNDDFGQDAVVGLEEELTKDKITLMKLPFDRGTTNFSGIVSQAKQAGIEHAVFLGIPRDAALVMKEAANQGWHPTFSGHSALGDPQTFKLAGNAAVEGAVAVTVMEPLDSKRPAVLEFLQLQKKYLPNTTPTTYSMEGFNAAELFVEAVKRAKGNTSPDAIVAALEAMKNYETGLMGPLGFSKTDHAGSHSVAFMKAHDGKWDVITDYRSINSK